MFSLVGSQASFEEFGRLTYLGKSKVESLLLAGEVN
jgi:hypothetical protein